MYEVEAGTLSHTIQEDSDIVSEKGDISSNGKGKIGNFYTINLVSDPSKFDPPVPMSRPMIRNNYEYMNDVQNA
jgi:hypothetical protein